MKLKRGSKGKFVGLSSFVMAFALLGTAVLCPFSGECAEAASSQRLKIDFVVREALSSKRLTIDFFLTSSGGVDYQNIAKQLGIDFYIKEKINLGISGVQDVDGGTIAPTVGGTTVSGKTDFTVGTNNSKGLDVRVSGDENMTNAAYAGSTVNVVKATTTEKVLGQLDANTWGYNLGATVENIELSTLQYKGVTADGETEHFTNGDHNLTLAFGAKVNTGVGAGEYSSKVKVEVAASAASTAAYVSFMNTIDNAIMEMKAEDPDFARRFDERQAELKAQYEARMNGEEIPEDSAEVVE